MIQMTRRCKKFLLGPAGAPERPHAFSNRELLHGEPACAAAKKGADGRIQKLVSEIKDFYVEEFKGERYFTLIYGSYSYGLNLPNSDLDLVTVCNSFDHSRLQRVIRHTERLHAHYGLEVDVEVPYEKKLLATFDQLGCALAGGAFAMADNRIAVPPVVKTKEFLESEEVAMRLLLNALTGKSIFVCGSREKYASGILAAREKLVAFMFSIENAGFFTPASFVDSLMGTPEKTGELYLGYKDVPAIRNYLQQAFLDTFERMVAQGKLCRRAGAYAIKDHGWFMSSMPNRESETNSSKNDFSNNLNPFGPPKDVIRALSRCDLLITEYPAMSVRKPISQMSGFLGVPENFIKVLAGSTEFFFIAPNALGIKKGILFTPTFWFPLAGLNRAKKDFVELPLNPENGFKPDLAELEKTIKTADQHGLAVYLCNPNNPTGVLLDKQKLVALAKKFPCALFIIDETYLLFHDRYEYLSLIREIPENHNILVVSSLSKFFRMPGVRLGFAVASPDKIGKLDASTVPYGINRIGEAALERVFSDSDFIAQGQKWVRKERSRVLRILKRINQLRAYPSEANYILCEIKQGNATSKALADHLAAKCMKIRDCSGYGNLNDKFFRFSIRTKEENTSLMKEMRRFFMQ